MYEEIQIDTLQLKPLEEFTYHQPQGLPDQQLQLAQQQRTAQVTAHPLAAPARLPQHSPRQALRADQAAYINLLPTY